MQERLYRLNLPSLKYGRRRTELQCYTIMNFFMSLTKQLIAQSVVTLICTVISELEDINLIILRGYLIIDEYLLQMYTKLTFF